MEIVFLELFKKRRNQDRKDLATELVDQLRDSVDIDDVIKILSGYNKRGLFVEIIDKLLDENVMLRRRIEKVKEEKELEII